MRSFVIDRFLVGATGLTALVSLAWFGGSEHGHRNPATEGVPAVDYLREAIRAPTVKFEPWQPPRAQTRGAGWVYDVFTPPAIGYDESTREFTVTPPVDSRGRDDATQPPVPVLLAVEREPFRLQLVGYVGEDGNYLGAFENLDTTEVFLGGTGREIPATNWVVTDFSLRRLASETAEGANVNPWTATAVVHDQRTGVDRMLRQGERAYTNELRAILAEDPDEEDSVVELRMGEEFQSSDEIYRIERLQLDPPTAELTSISFPTAQPLRVTLTASEVTDFANAETSRFISHDDE